MTPEAIIELIKSECMRMGVKTLFSAESHVEIGGVTCNGYFVDSPEPLLAVGTGKDPSLWLPILIHEYCHAQQWSEQCAEWTGNKITEKIEAVDLIDLYLSGTISFNDAQKSDIFQKAIEVEKDCEKRVVEFIKNHGIENLIDPNEYAQKANSYVLFYHMVAKTGKWYTPHHEPYNNPQIFLKMPAHFNLDYTKLTPELEQALSLAYS